MNRRSWQSLVAFAALASLAPAAPGSDTAPALPRTFLIDANELAATRARLAAGETDLQPALERLRADAEAALRRPARSVLEKTHTPASGDKHDYFSFGIYWWPDPAKPDGLPYLKRDGHLNPEAREGVDTPAFYEVCASVQTLGLAWYLTGDERYAAKAAGLARTWFLDPATRMNPNLQHAQAIPGRSKGRGIGLIESRVLPDFNEGIALIRGSAAWTADDESALTAWMEQFYAWITTSRNGLDEAAAENNHGTWYDAQVAHLALVLGKTDDARRIVRDALAKRLEAHVEPDGSQPLELARTRPLHYSLFNLHAFVQLACLGDAVGVDWWHHAGPGGRSLGAAFHTLAPWLDPAHPTPEREVEEPDRALIYPLTAAYLRHRPDDTMLREAFARNLPATESATRWRLWTPVD